jgi:hypothetical protein
MQRREMALVALQQTTNTALQKHAIEVRGISYQCNEEPICQKTRQASLQSIIPKDVMTSLLSLLTSNRRKIFEQFSTGFWQNKTSICAFSSKKLM